MTPEQFTYWLQGFVELSGDTQPAPEQWKAIRDHLQTVFVKVTPQYLPPARSPELILSDLLNSRDARDGIIPTRITC